MKIKRVDHLVLTVNDVARAIRFYHEVFDMPIINFKDETEPHCVRCGHQLLNFKLLANRNSQLLRHQQLVALLFQSLPVIN